MSLVLFGSIEAFLAKLEQGPETPAQILGCDPCLTYMKGEWSMFRYAGFSKFLIN